MRKIITSFLAITICVLLCALQVRAEVTVSGSLNGEKFGTPVSETVANDAGSSGGAGYGLINPLGGRTVTTLIADLIKWISGLAGTFFMIYLLWGGFEWMTSAGEPKKIQSAQDRMTSAMFGIIIIFTAYFIVEALIGVTNIRF
jgi:hypothetical protein